MRLPLAKSMTAARSFLLHNQRKTARSYLPDWRVDGHAPANQPGRRRSGIAPGNHRSRTAGLPPYGSRPRQTLEDVLSGWVANRSAMRPSTTAICAFTVSMAVTKHKVIFPRASPSEPTNPGPLQRAGHRAPRGRCHRCSQQVNRTAMRLGDNHAAFAAVGKRRKKLSVIALSSWRKDQSPGKAISKLARSWLTTPTRTSRGPFGTGTMLARPWLRRCLHAGATNDVLRSAKCPPGDMRQNGRPCCPPTHIAPATP